MPNGITIRGERPKVVIAPLLSHHSTAQRVSSAPTSLVTLCSCRFAVVAVAGVVFVAIIAFQAAPQFCNQTNPCTVYLHVLLLRTSC